MSSDRYKINPFLRDMIVPVKERKVRLSSLKGSNDVLIDQSTGEVKGTHLTTYKRVDSEQFVKLFTANIALTFDLSGQGIKAFSVLTWAMQHRALATDEICLDTHTREDFIAAHDDAEKPLRMSQPTFARGLAELTKAKIIAKTLRQGIYWINPNFIFNGDRIAFTTVIERRIKSEQEILESRGQGRLVE